jgi:hypothetical protein
MCQHSMLAASGLACFLLKLQSCALSMPNKVDADTAN